MLNNPGSLTNAHNVELTWESILNQRTQRQYSLTRLIQLFLKAFQINNYEIVRRFVPLHKVSISDKYIPVFIIFGFRCEFHSNSIRMR